MPVTTYLKTIDRYLNWPNAVELQVDRLGEMVIVTDTDGVHFVEDERLDLDYFEGLARVISNELDILEFHKTPFLSTSIPGGHRLELNIGNFIKHKVAMAIRIWRPRRWHLDDYGMTDEILNVIRIALQQRWNILISGGMFAGKTALANAIVEHIPADDRAIAVQDLPEFDLTHIKRHVEYYVNRLDTDNGITHQRSLLSLTRMSPERILINELNVDNTWPLVKILNTGLGGVMGTIHGDDCESALEAMVTNIDAGGIHMSNARKIFEDKIHLILQISKVGKTSERRVTAARVNPPPFVSYENDPIVEWVKPMPQELTHGL